MRSRLIGVAVAVLSIVVGGLATFGLLVWDDTARRPGGIGGGLPIAAVPLVLGVALVTFFAAVGVAVAPRRIVETGARGMFSAGVVFAGLAVACALAVQLFFITWPLAAVLAAISAACFVAAFRRARAAPA